MFGSALAAIVKILMNLAIIPGFGYIAAGYTTLICYILLSLLHYGYTRRICKKEIGGASVYDVKTMLLLSAGMLGMMFICLMLYNNTLLRYAIIAVGLVLVFCFRRKIVGIIRQIV